MDCPGCDASTSTWRHAVKNGEACPYCHLPNATIVDVARIRRAYQNSRLRNELVQVTVERDRAMAELRELRAKLEAVRRATQT